MEKVLFIDRDGTIIWEPPVTYQIDGFEKLKFLPGSIYWLTKIAKELDFTLVMVTNQDGLGTDSFPEKDFWPVQNFIIDTLKNEGVVFKDVFIDKSFPEQKLPTRKPGTAMLTAYMNGNYDLANSFVIGDRATDVELAKNLGSKSIFIQTEESKNTEATYSVNTWEEIYTLLKLKERTIVYSRNTNETKISVELNLDGKGKAEISTGLPFFDHMLEQIARHSSVDMKLTCKGDLYIDEHHTIEDTAITLGEAFLQALGDKRGIERYAFCLPMDDCLAQVALDFGGRNWIEWNAEFKREKIGDMPTEMFYHFFKSFSDAAKCNLNIKAEGANEHHKIEAIFKGLAKCIKQAVKRDINNNELPSTKGTL